MPPIFSKSPPIFKLGCDLLYEVFAANAPWETPLYESLEDIQHHPLNTTRRTSQVCQTWRQILLDSPAIWGRCIYLYALNQTRGHWRDLVLQRSGQSMLSVTGRNPRDLVPGSGLTAFLVKMIEEIFSRVAKFEVYMHPTTLKNTEVWRAFGRPAENLRFFALSSEDWYRTPRNLPADYKLFGDIAPSLYHLALPREFVFLVNLKAPMIFNANIRSLTLNEPINLSDVDLLTACMHMPSLESLTLKISGLILEMKSTNTALLRPSMPKLRSINISGRTLDVYHGFLDRIILSRGYFLTARHELDSWSKLPSDKKIKDLEHMQCVIQQFVLAVESYVNDDEDKANLSSDAWLEIHSDTFIFSSYSHHVALFFTHAIPFDILQSLLQYISELKYLLPHKELCLSWCLSDTSLTEVPPMLNFIKPMAHITVLETSLDIISQLGQITDQTNLFPLLEAVVTTGTDPLQSTDVELRFSHIISFFERRYSGSTPVQVFDLRGVFWPLGDFRSLNKLTGLTVKWDSENGRTECIYVCGSGDGEQLLLYNDADDDTK